MIRRNRRLLLSALVLALFVLAAEVLVRLRARTKYGETLDVYELFEPHPRASILVPRAGLDVDFGRRFHIRTDSRGFRSPELEHPKAGGTVRLAFLGGSTTFCGQARTNASTWPHRLVERLAADVPELDFDYLNAGVTGYSVEDSLASLRLRVAALDPDVVVIYHAAKDLADDTRRLAAEQGLVDGPPEPVFEAARRQGWLEERSLLWRLLRKNLEYLARQRAGRSEEDKLAYDPEALSRGFAERLEALVREAQEVADVVALATFTTRVRRDQPHEVQLDACAQAFTFTPYLTPEGILDGYEAYNERIREVARRTGSVLIDAPESVPGTEEYFHDTVHFTEKGYDAMARRAHDALAGAEAYRGLLETTAARR